MPATTELRVEIKKGDDRCESEDGTQKEKANVVDQVLSRRDVDHHARTVKMEQLHQKEGARKPPARRESESALRAIA